MGKNFSFSRICWRLDCGSRDRSRSLFPDNGTWQYRCIRCPDSPGIHKPAADSRPDSRGWSADLPSAFVISRICCSRSPVFCPRCSFAWACCRESSEICCSSARYSGIWRWIIQAHTLCILTLELSLIIDGHDLIKLAISKFHKCLLYLLYDQDRFPLKKLFFQRGYFFVNNHAAGTG